MEEVGCSHSVSFSSNSLKGSVTKSCKERRDKNIYKKLREKVDPWIDPPDIVARSKEVHSSNEPTQDTADAKEPQQAGTTILGEDGKCLADGSRHARGHRFSGQKAGFKFLASILWALG